MAAPPSPVAAPTSPDAASPDARPQAAPAAEAPAAPLAQDPLLSAVTKTLAASPVSSSRLDILHQSFEPQVVANDIPHFDAAFLESLERNAHACAQNVTHLLATLRTSLNTISSLSIQQLEAYRLSVDNLKNAVHLSVVASHELVQKSQQLHEDMKQVEVVAAQIRDMRKMMDTLDAMSLQYEKQRRRSAGNL